MSITAPTAPTAKTQRTFAVEVYDAYSGWDVQVDRVGRRAAWDACAGHTCVRVTEYNADGTLGDTVYTRGSEEQDDHAAWLGRCRR